MKNNNIYLIGFMGAGKTTVGSELAKLTSYTLLDTDQLIVEDSNMDIVEIFELHGEDYFRDLESNKLIQISNQKNLIVSTGGGIIIREKNRKILSKHFSIYLRASYEIIFNRIKKDQTRPLLNTDDPYSSGLKLFESRKEIYESFDFSIDTDNLEPVVVAKEILKIYRDVQQS